MSELVEILAELRAFVDERDWRQFHDPKNLAMAVASEAGELAALLRWVENAESDEFAARIENRRAIAAEIADVAIFLLLLADRLELDLPQTIRDKIAANRENHPVELTRGHARRVRRKSTK
jgi:NTP pyrophosphatase (non-canonical NTP hydrolase)